MRIKYLLAIGLNLAGGLILCGCVHTFTPVTSSPHTNYPDATTPKGMNEYNGGIIDDITVSGRQYNVVTSGAAEAVEKWQGSRKGFITVNYGGYKMTAIDKGIIFLFDTKK